ncbi:hypothetical protein LCGC14_2505110, partial [marine sediment metagenome]
MSEYPEGSYGREMELLHDKWQEAVKPLKEAVCDLPWPIRWLLYLLYPFLRYKKDEGSSTMSTKKGIAIGVGALVALVFACLFGFLLASLGYESTSEVVEVTRVVEVSDGEVPLEVTRLVEVEVTRIVEVISDQPEPESEIASDDPAWNPKEAGMYLVGVD